jgi:DNA-binding LacI/PurR family transcriptional regulator
MLDFERVQRVLSSSNSIPLHFRLRAAINDQIAEGLLTPGEVLPSVRVLRVRLNISLATVREALQSLVDAGLVQSVPGSGNYVLERQSLLPGSQRVAMLVSEPSFYIYYARLAAAFNHRMHHAGYRLEMSIHNENIDQFRAIADHLLSQQVAAVVINASNREDVTPIIANLQARGVFVVLIGRKINYSNADFVGVDNQLIGYRATQHLVQLGHRHIAYIGDAGLSTGRERAAGYIRALQEAGLTPRIFNGPYIRDVAFPAWFSDFVDLHDDPQLIWQAMADRDITAAFCFNDGTAAWMMKEMRKRNLNVPRDVSLISVDNLPSFQFLDAPLTTFALPGEDVGAQAADLLLRRLRGESFSPQRVLLPGTLVQRLSTAPPPTA